MALANSIGALKLDDVGLLSRALQILATVLPFSTNIYVLERSLFLIAAFVIGIFTMVVLVLLMAFVPIPRWILVGNAGMRSPIYTPLKGICRDTQNPEPEFPSFRTTG